MLLRLRQLLAKPQAQVGLTVTDAETLPLAVLEFQSPTAAVIATQLPMSARSTNYSIATMVFIMLMIASLMKVDRQVVAISILNSSSPNVTIQAFNSSSIVRSINVIPGQIVHRGDVVARLDPTYATADLTALTQQEQNYAAQVAQLQAQEDGKPYVPDPANPYSALQLQTYNQQMSQYNYTIENFQQQVNQLQTEINGYNNQAAYYRQRLGIASNVETMRKKLQQLQVGSELDTEAATDERVSMQASLDSAISSSQADAKQLASVTAQMNSAAQQFKAQTSTELATALNNLSQAQQALTKAQLDNQQVALIAPRDSVVASIAQVSPGSVMQPGQTLMTLAPVNASFTVEADVDATESGYVRPGQKVSIEFATLPAFQHGSALGTVLSVSNTSYNPQDQSTNTTFGAPLPGAPTHLYYKAEISLDEMSLYNVPPGFQLVPGMPINAYIIIGSQTIIGYFFNNLSPLVTNALHEP